MSPSPEASFVRPIFAATVAAALLLAGCGEEPPVGGPPPVTEILRVEVDPNPVAAGDTAVFTCVVRDSLNPRLQYEWDLDGGPIPFPTTDTNQYQWKAPSDTGRYRHRVEVDDPDRPVFSVQASFEVLVTEN